jgi:predicted DNA binding CopG/RHH family protein
MVDTEGQWNVRKNLGFKSQSQYNWIKEKASSRGLTVAKYLVWLAEVHGNKQGEEQPLFPDSDVERLNIRLSARDMELVRSCSKSMGISANGYLIRLVREDHGRARKWSVPDRQAELKLAMAIETCIAQSNPEEALEALQQLKAAIVNSQLEMGTDSGEN